MYVRIVVHVYFDTLARMPITCGKSPAYAVVEAAPLGTIIAGWKPNSPGVTEFRLFPHQVLVLTTTGRAHFRDERGRSGSLTPGSVLALFPGIRHVFTPEAGQRWDEFYVIFSGPVFAPWQNRGLFDPSRPILQLGDPQSWLRRFAAVVDPDEPSPALGAVARMQHLLADVLLATGSARLSPAEQAWFTAACHVLSPDSGHPSLTSVARRLNLSVQVLRKRFRALAGIAPGVWRERQRLEQALRLLRDHSVGEVAHALGFCDQFHFSRRFKSHYGIAPTEFKRTIGS